MKRLFAALVTLILIISVCGCAGKRTNISREEIVAAYEAAGYSVSSKVYDEALGYGQIAYVQADHPNGDYIYFAIFQSEADAKSYKSQFYHPGMMGLFSAIFGDPSWPTWKVYGCIVVQYDDPNHFYPFEGLLAAN